MALPLTLPDDLVETANRVLYKFPNAHEPLIGEYAEKWLSFGQQCFELHDTPKYAVGHALNRNEGAFIESFGVFWNGRVGANSRSAADAATVIGGLMASAGMLLLNEKKAAIDQLKALHDFMDRYTWAWVPFGGFDERAARETNDRIDEVSKNLAELSERTRSELDNIARSLEAAHKRLTEATAAMKEDRRKLDAAF